MYSIRVYGKNRDIPWVKDEQQTAISLRAGAPITTDDEAMVAHLRLFNRPAEGLGIEITAISQPKSVRSMTLDELRERAILHGAEYTESDSRMAIMNKLKEV